MGIPASGRAAPPGVGETAAISSPVVGVNVDVFVGVDVLPDVGVEEGSSPGGSVGVIVVEGVMVIVPVGVFVGLPVGVAVAVGVGVLVGVVLGSEKLKARDVQAFGACLLLPALTQSTVPATLQLNVPLGTETCPKVAL